MLRILSFLLSAPCLIPVGAILIWTLPELDLSTPLNLAEPSIALDLPAWLFLLYTHDTVSLLGLTCLMAALLSFPLAWFTRFFQYDAGPVRTLWRELNTFESRQGLGLKPRQKNLDRRPSESPPFLLKKTPPRRP